VAPAFGLSALDLSTAAYYLLCNGFEVVRFDPTHHVGASDGEIFDFTMTRFDSDLACVLERYAPPTTAVIAISLSSRCSLRALAGRKLAGVIMMSPVVNTRRTLHAVTGEDLIGMHIEGTLGTTYNVLGFVVGEPYILDCVAAGFTDLKSSIAEAARITAPTWMIAGSHDQWVELDEVKQVAGALRNCKLVPLSGANHQMFRSPTMLHVYLQAMLGSLFEAFAIAGAPVVPAFKDVVRFVSQFKRSAAAAASAAAGASGASGAGGATAAAAAKAGPL
jgi:acyl transferase